MAAALLFTFTGCGDDDGSNAQDEVCDDRNDLREAVDDVVADLRAGNFGNARDGVDDVEEAFHDLQASLQNLGQDQREALQPDVDAIRSDVESLPQASSLDDLRSRIDAIVSGTQAIFDNITDLLNCD